ncbi:MAG: HAD family hydrolase [Candidatus Microsaccharimonas sp.]
MNDGGQPMYRLPQMAIFDIDGTITAPHSSSISEEVLRGFEHLRDNGVITTISTGRTYVRMKEALGENFDSVINDKALISVEHGAKIVNKWGKVIVESEFTEADIDKLVEFTGLNIDMVEFMAFSPADLARKIQIWCPEPADVAAVTEKRGYYADVYAASLMDVKEHLKAQPISSVFLKLKSFIHVENLKIEFTGGSIKAIFQDGALEYMKSKVTKARAISYMCKYFGIYEHNILVAGNAMNDVDMLNMETKYRVLVGPEGRERDTVLGYMYAPELLTYVDTPDDLGRFLQTL